jgi:hypothetical protein
VVFMSVTGNTLQSEAIRNMSRRHVSAIVGVGVCRAQGSDGLLPSPVNGFEESK